MSYNSNRNLTANSQVLRKNMTKEERHLWYDCLKRLSIPFHRQKTLGVYIVDFYCDRAKLIVELDGSQHFEKNRNRGRSTQGRSPEGNGIHSPALCQFRYTRKF